MIVEVVPFTRHWISPIRSPGMMKKMTVKRSLLIHVVSGFLVAALTTVSLYELHLLQRASNKIELLEENKRLHEEAGQLSKQLYQDTRQLQEQCQWENRSYRMTLLSVMNRLGFSKDQPPLSPLVIHLSALEGGVIPVGGLPSEPRVRRKRTRRRHGKQ